MRAGTRRFALLLGVALAGCSDGVGPGTEDSVGLLFSLEVPAGVSAAETTALGAAFDQVDSYQIIVQDSVSDAMLVADTVTVGSGLTAHSFDFSLPSTTVGLRVRISMIGFDGSVELYRATQFATVQAAVGRPTPVLLSIRYTGPGLRGTVTNDSGAGQGGVSVGLYQATNLVRSVSTEPDGTYLFLNVAAGSYSVQPTPPPSLSICPVARTVTVQGNEALVADFRARDTPCQIDVLVLSGGDVDDTQVVADLFVNTPGVTAQTFFYVNRTPGLATLRQYDVVLLFTNGIFDETSALGTELAQYVQVGGNLVIGSFYYQGRSDSGFGVPGWGQLQTLDPFVGDGDPFTGHAGATYAANSLATNSVVPHALTLGVSTITSVAGYSAGVLAKPSTTVVASWTDGAPLIGYRVLGGGQRIVGVSLFPGAAVPTEVSGDVQVLWENAVTWAGVAGGPTP